MVERGTSNKGTRKAGLTVGDLAARRGGRMIFRGLSFSVAGGQALVVAGPNGSGKSTLLRLLTGLTPPDSGSIHQDPDEPEHVRYISHRDGLKGALTVHENLAFWSAIYGVDIGTVDTAMDRLALSDVADMPADMLSAGWRRRVGLARLIIGAAPLWILDEPYTSLDSENVARIDALISDHLEQDGLVVLATHQRPSFAVAQTIDMAAYAAPPEAAVW